MLFIVYILFEWVHTEQSYSTERHCTTHQHSTSAAVAVAVES